MKKLLFTTLITCCCFWMKTAYAQNPTKILAPYYFSENGTYTALPTVAGNSNPAVAYTGFRALHSQNIQMDPLTGKILFFIVDGIIYDRKGRFIGELSISAPQNIPFPNYSQGVSTETLIVPGTKCTNMNVFFLFSTHYEDGFVTGSLGSYDKLTIAYDYQDNLIAGSVLESSIETSNNEHLLLETLIGNEYKSINGPFNTHCHRTLFAATKELSGSKRYVYVNNSRKIFRLSIINNVLAYDNYFIDLDTYFTDIHGCYTGEKSEMEMVNVDNQTLRIAFPLNRGSSEGFGTLDFSTSSGNVISGTAKAIEYPNVGSLVFYIKGVEFSPNGQRLFLTHDPVPLYPGTLEMFDLTSPNPFSTRQTVSNLSDFKFSQIESCSDNASLMIASTTHLYKINNSNAPGTPSLTAYNMPTYPVTCASPCGNGLEVILMQDQIDGENYSNNYIYSYSDDVVTIANTTTWISGGMNPYGAATNIYIRDELRIKAGAKLTVQGLTIHFGPYAKVIIENGSTSVQGGILNLDNATLTADVRGCTGNLTNMWNGVEVWGNSTVSQGTLTNSQQGRLIMSFSEIKNAYYGAAARKMVVWADAARYGGIIHATRSSFTNNHSDVFVTNYTLANNLSSFSYCTFKTTSLLNNPALALGNHVTLDQVKGIYFTGCTFKNDNPSLFGLSLQGVGIFANNAIFGVLSGCSAIPPVMCFEPDMPSHFTNLTTGIKYTSTNSTMTFSCDGALFSDNILGISATGAQNLNLVRNKFYVRELSIFGSVTQSGGINLVGCTGYTVQENYFEGRGSTGMLQGLSSTYGIVVKNSGIGSNLIYRNKFVRLRTGGQSELTNGSIHTGGNGTGLLWQCNQFIHPIYGNDLTVMDGTINYHQGYPNTAPTELETRKKAANNKFSLINEGMPSEHDLYVSPASPDNINYVDYLNDGFYSLDSYTPLGKVIVSNVTYGAPSGTIYLTYQADACPSNYFYGHVFLAPAQEESQASNGDLSAKSATQYDMNNPVDRHRFEWTTGVERHSKIYSIIMDTSSANTNDVLIDYLSTQNDIESQKMLAEILFMRDGQIDNALSEKLDADYLKLLQAKKEFSAENISLKPLLAEISKSEDVLVAEQAKAMLSLMEPVDLTFRFMEVEASAGTEENSGMVSTESLSVYPNPTNDKLTIRIDITEGQAVTAKVYSVLGSETATWKLDFENKSFNVNDFTPGIYLIHLTDQNGSLIETLKFVKQ